MAKVELTPRKWENGKYGYVDKAGGTVVEPVFDRADEFVEGFATVMVGGKWGFLKPDGTYLCEPQFDDLEDFEDGRAYVEVGERQGFVNTQGGWLLGLDEEVEIKESRNGRYGLVNPAGAWVVKPQFTEAWEWESFIIVCDGDAYGWMNRKGRWLNEFYWTGIEENYDRGCLDLWQDGDLWHLYPNGDLNMACMEDDEDWEEEENNWDDED